MPWRRLWNVLERLWRCLEASWRRLWGSWSVLRTSWKCAEAVSSTGIVFSACAEVRRDVRRGSFLDRGRVFSVRRGAQRRAQRQFPRQGSCFQRAQSCAVTWNCKMSLAKPLLLAETFEKMRFWTKKVSQNVNTFEKVISKV